MTEKIIGYAISAALRNRHVWDALKFYSGGIEAKGFDKVFSVIMFTAAVGTIAAIVIYWIVNFLYDGREITYICCQKKDKSL